MIGPTAPVTRATPIPTPRAGLDPCPFAACFTFEVHGTAAGNRMDADIIMALRKAGLRPEVEYAFRKTGLLHLGGDRSQWPKDRIEEWDAAVAEYRLLVNKEGGLA